jgi:hypothetical protein
MTSRTSETSRIEHLRLKVVYALLVFAHSAGIGEEPWGEEWSIEVCSRSGVEGSCSQARRGKYGSSEPRR